MASGTDGPHSEAPVPAGDCVLHATAICLDNRAILIRGPSGSGKSDLALRCLMRGAGPPLDSRASGRWQLVGDDYVNVAVRGGALMVSPATALRGKLEVRGMGILNLPYAREARVVAIADLAPRDDIERLPAPHLTEAICGIEIPAYRICAFDASAPEKIALALTSTEADWD